ncbi:hypothetical protein [Nitrosopumilus sp.]|uniref:hypothetical protein n=1 Tax=Nitrosopumilus sp. TaxID=2024843 RepID=UPI003B59E143
MKLNKELVLGVICGYLFVYSMIAFRGIGIFYYFQSGTGWAVSVSSMIGILEGNFYNAFDVFPILVLWASLPIMIWITKDLELKKRIVYVGMFELFFPVVIWFNYGSIMH